MRPVVGQAPLASYDMLTCTISFVGTFEGISSFVTGPSPVAPYWVAQWQSACQTHEAGKRLLQYGVQSYHLPGIPWVVVEAATTGLDPCTVKARIFHILAAF